MSRHISEQYDAELDSLRRRLMEMGGLVEHQVRDACQAILTHDSELAKRVRATDKEVNELELEIDDQCIHIIARRQPAASDLRLLIAMMKVCTDLERVGDESGRIAKCALGVIGLEVPTNQYAEIRHIAGLASGMLSRSLDALARLDVDAALANIAADAEVDRAYDVAIRDYSLTMEQHPETVKHLLNVFWAARALERIGDHAKNIAEHVVFLVKGQDVRHTHKSGAARAN
jgi:phosphate transport system protein